MQMQIVTRLFFSLSLLMISAVSTVCLAHTSDISTATLSLENAEKYQLTVKVDILHLLKRHLEIEGNDEDVIKHLQALSFRQQKQLLDNLHTVLAQQTLLHFSNDEQSLEQYINVFTGLSLNRLKQSLATNTAITQAEIEASGNIPQGMMSVSVRFSSLFSDVQLTIVRPQHQLVSNNKASDSFAIVDSAIGQTSKLSQSILVIKDYIVQGFIHILPRGLDHILFVLALFLFAKTFSSLLWQVSAFTLAHTVTLALGIYGVVQLPSAIVEPLIALSILYVALENFYRAKSNTSSHTRMPVIFAFGLLHGLGFASVLSDVGLPESQYALSLISFNVGVELGQLSVILIAFLCLAPVMKKQWYQPKLVKTLNIVIAIMASYWLIERVF